MTEDGGESVRCLVLGRVSKTTALLHTMLIKTQAKETPITTENSTELLLLRQMAILDSSSKGLADCSKSPGMARYQSSSILLSDLEKPLSAVLVQAFRLPVRQRRLLPLSSCRQRSFVESRNR
jgi:hypothetical protein